MKDYLVDEQTALDDFNRWAETMGIDLEGLDEDDAADVARHRRRIVNAIKVGAATINDVGDEIAYKPQRSDVEPFKFYEPKGEAWLASDKSKKGHSIAQINAVLASVTRRPPKMFANLASVDYKFCQSVAVLFLG